MPASRLPTTLLMFAICGGLEASDAEREHQAHIEELKQRDWRIRAAPVEKGEIELDGALDEPAWARAEPVSDFYQRERHEGEPATERTEVYVLFDHDNVYFGFKCYDSEPGKVRANGMFRDEAAGSDDLISLMIDPFHDHRSAIQLAANASGLALDLAQNGETRFTRNLDWDMVWQTRGRHTDWGWEVEIAIPFKSLRFERPTAGAPLVFGIGFKRNIPRKNEEVYWPFVSNDSTWYRPAEMGHLLGLDAQPGKNLELRPYGLVGRQWGDEPDDSLEAGGDLKWGVTPGLTLDATVNTDFAQEEADIQQINLTRFSLFFPEKRQLFLEGQRSFQFGLPALVDLVFTRRIGLSEDGDIIPIKYGARLSGRQGRWNIGAMDMQAGGLGDFPAENFAVARVRRDIFSRSNVGAVFTNRQGGGEHNRVVGADANFFIDEFRFEGFASHVDDSREDVGGTALFARGEYSSDRYAASYDYLDVDDGFEPGVGFVQRPGTRRHFAFLRYSPRFKTGRVRRLEFFAPLLYVENQVGSLESQEYALNASVEFDSGDWLWGEFGNTIEQIDEPFDLRDDITIDPGAYRFNRAVVGLSTFGRRPQRLELFFSTGGFWDGHRDSLNVDLGYRVNKHLDLRFDYEVNWLDFEQTQLTTHLAAGRVAIAFTPSIVLNALMQYNSDTDGFAANVRFNWIPKPGTDFFIVYNGLSETADGLLVRDRSVRVKLSYLFAF